MEELQSISTYKAFKAATDKEVLNQAEGFVRLGYLLRRARDTEILRDSGYLTVVEFAEKEYGLTETYVSRYIAINKRYSRDGYSPYLNERFQGYGMAKLAEMLTLSDEVVEALPPELPKAAIQEVKREIRQEQEITDLEVMLEGEEAGTEGETNLEKWLRVYFRENENDWQRAKATHSELVPQEWVMDVLAPTGIAAKMARIKGAGKFMLAVKGKYAPLELLNLRTNEKETYSLEECASMMERLWMQEAENKPKKTADNFEKNANDTRKNVNDTGRNAAEPKEIEPKEKIAPVQETQIQKEENLPAENMPEEARQMEIEDYPEMLPEGYTSIQCHDGSEVLQNGRREATALIWSLYNAVYWDTWSTDEIYPKAEALIEVLKVLKHNEGQSKG